MFFEVRTKRVEVDVETNRYRTVREQYLIDAVNFTESEAAIHKYMEEEHPGEEFTVVKIQPSRIQKLIGGGEVDTETSYWKSRVELLLMDEVSGKTHKNTLTLLIKAETVAEASKIAEEVSGEELHNSIEAVKTEKTKIVDVILPKKKEQN